MTERSEKYQAAISSSFPTVQFPFLTLWFFALLAATTSFVAVIVRAMPKVLAKAVNHRGQAWFDFAMLGIGVANNCGGAYAN